MEIKYPISAERLEEAMKDIGISAAELSRRTNVGKAAISHYLKGRNCPHNKNAVLLANVLRVNPTWLMGFDVPKNNDEKEDNSTISQINKELSKMDERKLVVLLAFIKTMNGGDSNED